MILGASSQPTSPSIWWYGYPTLPQLHYKDAVGDSIKCLAKIKVDYIHCSPHIHPTSEGLEYAQRRATKLAQGQDYKSFEEWLSQLNCLVWRRLREIL